MADDDQSLKWKEVIGVLAVPEDGAPVSDRELSNTWMMSLFRLLLFSVSYTTFPKLLSLFPNSVKLMLFNLGQRATAAARW